MTAKQKYQRSRNWQGKVLIIHLYHTYMLVKKKSLWSMRETSLYFNISLSNVSESLKLQANWTKVKDAPSRNRALKML